MIDLQKIADEKIAFISKQISTAEFERDHAATPTESASDKTRQIAEQLLDSLLNEKRSLLALKNTLKKYKPRTYKVDSSSGERVFVMVPDGLGGNVRGEYVLVSPKSAVGVKLESSSPGQAFTINDQEFKVLSVNQIHNIEQ